MLAADRTANKLMRIQINVSLQKYKVGAMWRRRDAWIGATRRPHAMIHGVRAGHYLTTGSQTQLHTYTIAVTRLKFNLKPKIIANTHTHT